MAYKPTSLRGCNQRLSVLRRLFMSRSLVLMTNQRKISKRQLARILKLSGFWADPKSKLAARTQPGNQAGHTRVGR
ncbi:hypothetical protein PGT21_024142 [Puccinia graminis f. sp. tritici]|uniref:Uncharacterized protein n=1 Tax=Puccinia graminis f. sp. tritici TaxID=56615 RepID=A0A5B0QJA0_PUCGR|nr:hypothetical protein PGT21_024142 [Puccinia graminis f. sp. tritici]